MYIESNFLYMYRSPNPPELSLTLDGLHKASRNIRTKPSSKSSPQIKARELLEKRKNELTETDNGSKVVTERYSGLRIR